MKRPSVKTRCVADAYAAPFERIVEFSDEHGNGGLISFKSIGGTLVVDIYRANGVEVRHIPDVRP